jgi:hypothetical protein
MTAMWCAWNRVLVGTLTIAVLTWSGGRAEAQALLEDGFSVAVPEISAPSLTLVDFTAEPFSAGAYSGVMYSNVWRSGSDPALIFTYTVYWLSTDMSVTLRDFSVPGFAGVTTRVAQPDLSFNPPMRSADRLVPGEVRWTPFAGTVGHDTFTRDAYVFTDATEYELREALIRADGTGLQAVAAVYAPVPEPATLVAVAALGALGLRRRRATRPA